MAYVRSSVPQQGLALPAAKDQHSELVYNSKTKRSDEIGKNHLHIFSVDLTNISPVYQFLILGGGLILFMCLYGYFQELVIYGWFNRKLSIFSTFLHFLGSSVFAQLQRNVSVRHHQSGGQLSPKLVGSGTVGSTFLPLLSMGTGSTRTAVFYYTAIVVTKTVAQWTSNLCMTQINYPAKTLFKSANPIITMLIGVLFLRKSYPLRDYVAVVLLVVGLYVFMTGGWEDATPQGTLLGVAYVSISMLGSAGVPMIQEHILTVYGAHPDDVLYFSFLGSTLVSFIFALLTGEFFAGLSFLVQNSSVHVWGIFVAFISFGFCGAIFGVHLTRHFGALSNAVTSTVSTAVIFNLFIFMIAAVLSYNSTQ
jgi:hypothetical protein